MEPYCVYYTAQQKGHLLQTHNEQRMAKAEKEKQYFSTFFLK